MAKRRKLKGAKRIARLRPKRKKEVKTLSKKDIEKLVNEKKA